MISSGDVERPRSKRRLSSSSEMAKAGEADASTIDKSTRESMPAFRFPLKVASLTQEQAQDPAENSECAISIAIFLSVLLLVRIFSHQLSLEPRDT